uniref:Peptidase M12B domain-containing protein n=1 Tax=Plectus sambesii TaxID=2011161 RepID=A0A914WW81_9BILA
MMTEAGAGGCEGAGGGDWPPRIPDLRREKRAAAVAGVSSVFTPLCLQALFQSGLHSRKARARRSANSWDHYVEVMVVTDVKMLQYHQGNLENYVLTLFSTVASIYRHPSLRAAINVVVVRLVILKHDQAGPSISENAQDTLQQFCRWQASYNDPSDDSPNHHDVAILLTRHDICRAPGKCDTLGLAELGTMCDEFRSCAIIEDNGLSAAFTIAHELGHIFNIPHDDEKKCGQFMALNKNNYHIMAPTLEYNTHPWSWSPCSAAMLSKFLDNSRAQTQCIYDQPVEKKYYEKMFDNPAPGAMFTVDQQCQFVFGKNAELCPYMPSCKRLWCATYYGYQMGCRTQHMPWADGTPCGDNQWCHRGQCVGIAPAQMPKSDGAWGEWKEWGDCSRTCGGGVQKALRDCDNPAPRNGGRYCIGIRTRYRPCNVQDCPWDTPGFREVQCADFNEKNVGIHGVPANTRWLPKYAGISENERCKLYCRVDGSAAFYLLADKVADGTPCDREGDNMCIDGTCNAAGCDHVLGSSLKRDKCGICGGDGNSCHMVTGAYNERGTFGYNEVMKIPSGSANIEIRQHGWNGHKDDDNYLALRNANGDFILNGHYQVSVFRQQIQVLDAVLEYSGSDHVIERINATGPIRTDIYLHVLSVGNLYAPDIHYEYMLPAAGLRHAPTVINRDYYWRMGDRWSDCSAVCQGSQRQVVICVDAGTNREVNDRHCTDRRPTTQDRMCNIDCAIRWETEAASACSVECGHGERHQRIFCGKQMVNDQRVEPTDDAHCRDLPRPAERVACYSDCTGHRWAYTEWSECTTSCGGGVGRREAMCVDQANRRLDDRQCESMPKEKNERECNLTPCPRWVYGHWSECSRSCDGGVRMRHASCQDAADREVQMGMCDQANKHDREKCNEQVCTKWNFGPWSQCSVSCGDGVQSREAHCVNSASQTLEEDHCDQRERITNKMCRQADCPRWQLGEWSDCSVSCMDGWRTRRVACVDGEGRDISMDRCIVEGENKPPSHQPCHRGVCPFWRIGDWSSCSVTCGTGFRQRTSECVYNDELVDSSFCSEPVEPKRQERCVLVACATWDVQPWDSCSVTCGVGTQQRRVRCLQGADRAETIDSECATDERPKDVKECTRDRCPLQRPLVGALISTDAAFNPADSTPLPVLSITTVAFLSETTTKHPIHWATGPWTECSSVCGAGERRRLVVCRDNYRSLTDEYCGHLEKPLDSEPCEAKPCAEWTVGPWEECAKTCGADIRTSRRVECELTDEARNQVPPKCDEALRPEDSRSCDLPACPAEPPRTEAPVVEGRWRTEPWGQCSATCGGGSRRRRVWCADERNILAETQCAQQPKPTGDERCAEHHCPTSTTTTPEPSTTFPPPSLQNTNGASLVWIAGRWSPVGVAPQNGRHDDRRQLHQQRPRRPVRHHSRRPPRGRREW